ncbi:MAG: UDP-N-acetylglucosamine 2-epimerase (non-hydrolyzing) [Candidatus Lokiarchaeota archaeon]|nr:UDP-N-acetylglucosamine 2-epimerase (non-hydrolyzing) [Candidatus Lokiarchaeota archaeon]
MKKKSIYFVMGTRPEIIKLAPIIRILYKESIDHQVIFTDQHYDYNLSKGIFKDLKLKDPKFHLNIGKGTQGEQTAKALMGIEKILADKKPAITLVQGDTNSALAGALAAVKLNLKIGHVEAGLRSYDYRMPEEHNRRMIDHISNYLFAPTTKSEQILKNENTWGEIFVTGNTVIDACLQHYKYAEKESKILKDIPFEKFVLVTAHRAENVDNKETLKNLVEIFVNLSVPIVFPIHPRTLNRLKRFDLLEYLNNSDKILLIPPVGYLDLLKLMHNCEFIITDSGGIQEEATAPSIHKFTFVIRKTSDRPESCEMGFSKLVGTQKDKVINEICDYIDSPNELPEKSPYGDGNASNKIIEILKKELYIT